MFRILSTLLAIGCITSVSSAVEPVFRAGAFAQDITPTKYPISINGGMTDRLAKGAHDKLHARCLVLDDGTTKLAFVVVDSCMVPREIFDPAKKAIEKATGIPTTSMMMSATHTHTAPTLGGVFQSDPDRDYSQYLIQKIAAGVIEAHKRLAPARIGWGVGKNDQQVFNRRWKMAPGTIAADPFGETTDTVKMNPGYQAKGLLEPSGPIDPDVSFISVQTADAKPLCVFANYSLHYVGGVEPVSADYFGAYADRMKQLLKADDGFVGIMSNGTSGDINNINFGGPAPKGSQPYERIRVVSDSVAQSTMAALKNVAYHKHLTLKAAEKEIELGVRLPSSADVERAQRILEKAPTPLKTLPEIYARETVLLAKYPPTTKARLQAFRVGELGVVSSPCETFVEIGLEIKKKSPLKPTFTIELANGYNGYLPTPEQHQRGGYETWRARSSYVEVNASTKITKVLFELLDQVAK
jgi:hypothetical protein